MKKKEEQKNGQGVKACDFTKVRMEVRFDEFQEADLSKPLANNIHQNTGDIGLDEIARDIYKHGRAEIPDVYIPVILDILNNGTSTLVVGAKRAIIELLTSK